LNTRPKIALVCPRPPLPVVKGDQVVTIQRIEVLSEWFDITLYVCELPYATIINRKGYSKPPGVASMNVVKISWWDLFRGFVTLGGDPLQVGLFKGANLWARVIADHKIRKFDALHVVTVRVFHISDRLNIPMVLDCIDCLGLNFRIRAARISFNLLKKAVFLFEAKRIARYEKECVNLSHRSIFVSQHDLGIAGNERSVWLPNFCRISKSIVESNCDNVLVISGNFNYWPNIEGVKQFIPIFKRLRTEYPGLVLKLCGKIKKNVGEALAKEDGVEVLGYVEDIGQELSKAMIIVVPVFAGSGMQNKVIEGLAAGRPLVISNFSNQPIGLSSQHDALVCENIDDFYLAIKTLLDEPGLRDIFGERGQYFAKKEFSVERSRRVLKSLYGELLVREL
jgi:polysaccharide biosynthesis protein PslH